MKQTRSYFFCILFSFVALLAFGRSLVAQELPPISDSKPYYFQSNEPHRVKLLNRGSSSFYKRIELIKNAKKSIELEYFIFNHDLAGKVTAQEILRKVREGVKVKLLVDNFMVGAELTPHHSAELLKRGIEIKFYNTRPLSHIVHTQYRNHRKIFVVDDKHYITGGRNIGDDYFDLSERYNFVDRDALYTGPSAVKARQSFDLFFDSKLSSKKFRPHMPTINRLDFLRAGQSQKARILQQARAKLRIWKERKLKGRNFLKLGEIEASKLNHLMKIGRRSYLTEFEGTCNNLEFVSDLPLTGPKNDKKRVTRNFIYQYLKEAKNKIVIDSPYFILNDKLISIIGDQLEKGVEVSLLTNGIYSSDALPVASVFNHYLESWIERGLIPSVYSGGPLFNDDEAYISKEVANSRWGTHSKCLSIDDDKAIIGTYNFDPRSEDFSAELIVTCHGNRELALALEENINLRRKNGIVFKNKDDVEKYEFENVSVLKKMGYYVLKPISLLLQSLL